MVLLSPARWKSIKAKIEPQLHWRVPFEAGIYANSPRWSNKDLDPIAPERRTWGGADYWAYWASDMVRDNISELMRIMLVVVILTFMMMFSLPLLSPLPYPVSCLSASLLVRLSRSSSSVS
jgi:hypothetical protein